nr:MULTISPECIES: hypothetical protein [Stenotrophomonas]
MAILAPGLPPAGLRWMVLVVGMFLWLASPRWRWLGALLAGMGRACTRAGAWINSFRLAGRGRKLP